MPTISPDDVERALPMVRDYLERVGPGEVVEYRILADDLRDVVNRTDSHARNRHHLHVLRLACERLRSLGEVELWGRSLKDGRWVIVWLRKPGRGPALPGPQPRRKRKYERQTPNHFRVGEDMLRQVESIILDLLRGPFDPRELLIASHPRPLPGPGWVPLYYLSCRLFGRITLTPSTRYNVLGYAVRSMAKRGILDAMATPTRNGRQRVRFVRLVDDPQQALNSEASALTPARCPARDAP